MPTKIELDFWRGTAHVSQTFVGYCTEQPEHVLRLTYQTHTLARYQDVTLLHPRVDDLAQRVGIIITRENTGPRGTTITGLLSGLEKEVQPARLRQPLNEHDYERLLADAINEHLAFLDKKDCGQDNYFELRDLHPDDEHECIISYIQELSAVMLGDPLTVKEMNDLVHAHYAAKK